MNRKIVLPVLLCIAGLLLVSCEKHEQIFDHPFVYITDNATNTTSSAKIDSQAEFDATYSVFLSSKTLDRTLEVYYELQPGDGLQEGVDYELLSPNPILFPVGLYINVIHVRWLPRQVDQTKDNSVKIVLKSNSINCTMGYPGPDKLNSYYTVTKVNM